METMSCCESLSEKDQGLSLQQIGSRCRRAKKEYRQEMNELLQKQIKKERRNLYSVDKPF
jgi:hypothetical protein